MCKAYQYKVILFTEWVAIEGRRPVVKNTDLKYVLVLQLVIEFFRCSQGAILHNSESALLVARPYVPERFVN